MDAAGTRRRSNSLAGLSYAVAAGVLTQAVLAGLFLSGVQGARMVLLIVAGLAITNIVAAMLFDRNTTLGVDELLVAVVGVGLALLVEFGVFRRGRP